MFKKLAVLLLCLVTIISLSACSNNEAKTSTPEKTTESKVKVSVTFNAMKEFAEAVGRDKIEVSTIIPDGAEAHDFEPKAQDLAALSSTEIFVYSGLGMESWVDEAIQSVNNPNLIIVNASEGADIIIRESSSDEHEDEDEHEESEHEHEDDEHDEHDHGKYDPHLWLGLKEAQIQAKNIKDALINVDPDNKDYYEKNFDEFTSQLEGLYNEYKEKFQSVNKKSFVTGHAAFGYLCRDFGLVQNSVRDIFADGEPSAQQLAKLVEYCRDNNVTTIFAEEMASPAVSETLANEVGAKVETIYTMESNEDNKTYLERMTENLEKIYDSLSK